MVVRRLGDNHGLSVAIPFYAVDLRRFIGISSKLNAQQDESRSENRQRNSTHGLRRLMRVDVTEK